MYVFPILVIELIHMSSRLENYASHFCKLYPYMYLANYYLANCIHIHTLQTVPILLTHCHLANYHLANCHLAHYHLAHYHLANCHLANYVFFFQCWAIKYGLITHGAEVDLKSFSLVRIHFGFTLIFPYYFLLHAFRILHLILRAIISYLESIGRCSCYCRLKLGGCYHHHFRDHPACRGCRSEGSLLGRERILLVGG